MQIFRCWLAGTIIGAAAGPIGATVLGIVGVAIGVYATMTAEAAYTADAATVPSWTMAFLPRQKRAVALQAQQSKVATASAVKAAATAKGETLTQPVGWTHHEDKFSFGRR